MKIHMLRTAWTLVPALLAGVAIASEEPRTSDEPAKPEPVRLGTTHAALQERFGEALQTVDTTPPRSLFDQIAERKTDDAPDANERDPFAEQQRLSRTSANADVAVAEYDLFQGVVYRTRWRLDERFDRPLMPHLVAHLTERLGTPAYDQTIEAKLGSGKADLRRTGWRRGGRVLEIRQLQPFTGGPVFVSLADISTLDRIVDARGVVLTQPDSTAAWWSRAQRDVSLMASPERDALVGSIDALLETLEFERP